MRFSVLRLDEVNHGYDTRLPPDIHPKSRRAFEQYDKNNLRQIEIWLRDSAQILRLRWRTPALAYREYRRELAKIARHIHALNYQRQSTLYPPPEAEPAAQSPDMTQRSHSSA